MRAGLLALSLLAATAGAALAQPATATPPQQAAVQDSQRASTVSTERVAVPEPTERALAYYRSGNALWIISGVWGCLLPAILLFTGFSARMRDWAQRLGRKWFFVVGIYFAFFAIATFVFDLPLAYYQDYVREHAYDLSNQTLGKWFGDAIKGTLVAIVGGFMFAWVPYLLLKKSPGRWWLHTGILAVPFLFFIVLVEPVWVDPLFNDFGPMKNKALEARILDLADRAGIEGGRVFEVNKSADTKAINAYVNGFANTKRIVLWDTLIAKLDEPAVLFVMGHEMGHYVLGHVWKTVLFLSALIGLTLYAIHRTAGWLVDRYRRPFGFDRLDDVASLPLLFLLFSVYIFVVTPIALAFSRNQEHEADRFGLEITRNNHAAAVGFVTLQSENLSVPRPGPVFKLWRASHPTLGDRIDFCNDYRPWETGEPLVYGELFKNK